MRTTSQNASVCSYCFSGGCCWWPVKRCCEKEHVTHVSDAGHVPLRSCAVQRWRVVEHEVHGDHIRHEMSPLKNRLLVHCVVSVAGASRYLVRWQKFKCAPNDNVPLLCAHLAAAGCWLSRLHLGDQMFSAMLRSCLELLCQDAVPLGALSYCVKPLTRTAVLNCYAKSGVTSKQSEKWTACRSHVKHSTWRSHS